MMEKAVLEKIGVLRRAYKEKEQAYEAEHKKLQAYVEKYLDENHIWGNKELLGDVVRILPDSRLRSRLVECLYTLYDKEAEWRAGQGNEQEPVLAGGRDMGQSGVCGMPRHDPKALTEIKCMAGRYREKEQEFREEQKKLQEYVNSYLDENGIRNDVAKLNELADTLPGGIVLFRLREIICFLEEKMEGIGMDIKQRINKFNTENRPFYIVDHGNGRYSLCLAFSFLEGEYKGFGQDAFNRYAQESGEPAMDSRGMFTHGSGYEWQTVFEKCFEDDPKIGRIQCDCEAGGFFCYAESLALLEGFGARFRAVCMDREKFAGLVSTALKEAAGQQCMKESAGMGGIK